MIRRGSGSVAANASRRASEPAGPRGRPRHRPRRHGSDRQLQPARTALEERLVHAHRRGRRPDAAVDQADRLAAAPGPCRPRRTARGGPGRRRAADRWPASCSRAAAAPNGPSRAQRGGLVDRRAAGSAGSSGLDGQRATSAPSRSMSQPRPRGPRPAGRRRWPGRRRARRRARPTARRRTRRRRWHPERGFVTRSALRPVAHEHDLRSWRSTPVASTHRLRGPGRRGGARRWPCRRRSLTMKLACFSLTTAPPTRRALEAQPSMSAPGRVALRDCGSTLPADWQAERLVGLPPAADLVEPRRR